MKIKSKYLQMCVFGILAWGCSDTAEEGPVPEPVPVPDAPITYEFTAEQSRAAEASTPFMNKFWLEAEAQMGEDNYIVSPLSADVLLSMVANTSTGGLGKEIVEALGCSDKTVLNELASKYTVALPSVDSSTTLGIYNSVWYRNQYVMSENFADRMKYYFAADVVAHRFDNSLIQDANSWCSEKTKGLIPNIIKTVPEETAMLMIDALYLKGAWANPFKAENTTDEIFHGIKGDSEVKMMNAASMQHYARGENFQAVRMEMGCGAIEALFILPNEGVDMHDFLKSNIEAIHNASFVDKGIYFSFPRFKFVSNEMSLNDIFMNIGISSINRPDNSNVLEGCETLMHSIFQRTSLEFNEKGAEGAAVTWNIPQGAELGSETEPDPTPVVNVNRPFFLMVRVAATGAPLFAGRINNL